MQHRKQNEIKKETHENLDNCSGRSVRTCKLMGFGKMKEVFWWEHEEVIGFSGGPFHRSKFDKRVDEWIGDKGIEKSLKFSPPMWKKENEKENFAKFSECYFFGQVLGPLNWPSGKVNQGFPWKFRFLFPFQPFSPNC